MKDMIRKGTQVKWSWGSGEATGVVKEIREESVSREIKGAEVTRNGTQDDPALIIEQDDGTEVLKLKSEVSRTD